MSSVAVILICLGFGVSVVQSDIRCLDCQRVRHASECAKTTLCPPNQICALIASKTADGIFYRYQCGEKIICKASFSILALGVGKRKRGTDGHHRTVPGERAVMTDHYLSPAITDVLQHAPHSEVEQELCMDCCMDSDYCNRNLCLIPTIQTKPPAVVSTSPSPIVPTTSSPPPRSTTSVTQTLTTSTDPNTTTDPGDPNCRDHEEDGIKCSLLNMAQICSEKSMLGYVMMRKKCPMTCRLCKPVPNVHASYVVPPPGDVCEDFEQDGIKCVSLDLFDVCTDQTSLAVIVAHEKCRKHCGICTSHTTASSTTSTTTQATTITTTTTPATTPTTLSKATTACADIEDQTFSCADWASNGYCLPFPGVGYETSKKRCRKYCGYC